MQTSHSELENWYPKILAVIIGFWGTQELDTYLNKLIVRGTDEYARQGFHESTMSELIMLYYINSILINKSESDIWRINEGH